MNSNNVYYSDHTYKGSDAYETPVDVFAVEATYKAFSIHGGIPTIGYPRVAYRAVQTVRQARVQMHERQRTWTQILSDAQYLQRKAGCHLCSFGSGGEGKGIPRTFPDDQRRAQRNLRYKSGTSATGRHNLLNSHGHHQSILGTCLEKRNGNFGCQYAGAVLAQRYARLFIQGGFK